MIANFTYKGEEFPLNQQTLEMFKTLTELPGAPGNEHAVRAYMRTYLEQYSDEIVQDNLGGIFGVKHGEEGAPKILVAGHMDEVAFMVTQITENGMIRFQIMDQFQALSPLFHPIYYQQNNVINRWKLKIC